MPVLSRSQIKTDLENGLTRTPKEKNYNPEKGSIQEKYKLSSSQVRVVFLHPELKGLRTKVESEEITFIEDQAVKETQVAEEDTSNNWVVDFETGIERGILTSSIEITASQEAMEVNNSDGDPFGL